MSAAVRACELRRAGRRTSRRTRPARTVTRSRPWQRRRRRAAQPSSSRPTGTPCRRRVPPRRSRAVATPTPGTAPARPRSPAASTERARRRTRRSRRCRRSRALRVGDGSLPSGRRCRTRAAPQGGRPDVQPAGPVRRASSRSRKFHSCAASQSPARSSSVTASNSSRTGPLRSSPPKAATAASTRWSTLTVDGAASATRAGEIEVVGRQMVHRGAHRDQVEHPQPDTSAIGRRPVVAPACEARPARRAQDPGAQRSDPSIVGDAPGAQDQVEQFGGIGREFGDSRTCVASDDGSESAISTRHRQPRAVEAAVAVRELPRRVRLVDEGGTPTRHEVVERVGGGAVLSRRRRLGVRSVQQVPANQLDRVDSNAAHVDRLLIDDGRQVTDDRPVEVGIGHRATCVLGPIGGEWQVGARPEPASSRGGGLGERQVGQTAERVDRDERGQRPVGRSDRTRGGDVGEQSAAIARGEGACGRAGVEAADAVLMRGLLRWRVRVRSMRGGRDVRCRRTGCSGRACGDRCAGAHEPAVHLAAQVVARGPGVKATTATPAPIAPRAAATQTGPTAAGTSYGTTSTTKASNRAMPPT